MGDRGSIGRRLPPAPAPNVRDALAPIEGLRISSADIRAALEHLGPTGDKAEAYVKAAAIAAAESLQRLGR